MGKAKYIYFEDEVCLLLEKEGNMSFLINKLLKEHFGKKTDINAIKAELSAVEAQHEALAGSLLEASKKAAEKFDEEKKQAESIKAKQEEIEKKKRESPEHKERCRLMLKDAWKAWDSPAEEFDKFYEDYEKGLFKNIAGYCEANGIKKKEKKA